MLGSVLAAVVSAAILASRLAHATGAPWLSCWLTAGALLLPISLAIVVLLRAAARGLRSLQPERERRSLYVSVFALWCAGSAVGLTVFGTMIHAGTHHRGLGGTTFAAVGMAIILFCALVAARVSQPFRSLLQREWIAWILAASSAAVILAATGAAARPAPTSNDAAVAGLLVRDAIVVAMTSLAASRIRVPPLYAELAAPTSSGLFVLLVAAGLLTAPTVASAAPAVRAGVPILAPVLELLAPGAAHAEIVSEPEAAPSVSGSASAPPSDSAGARRPNVAIVPLEPIPAKPDVLLISFDSVRADHLGIYGYGRPTSPKLDSFAAHAIVFDHAYAAGPETRTAVAPLVTGLYLEQTARDDRPWPTLLDSNETLAERLRKAGYATGAVTSFQWLSTERGFSQGFALFDEGPFRKAHPEKRTTGAHAIAQAIRVYDDLVTSNKPVFLWVHLFDPHQKYLSHSERDFGDKDVDRYDGEIAYDDRELDRLIDHVRATVRGARTVWIIHGTHGDGFGEHGYRGHPPAAYQESIHVPLVVAVPSGAGRRIGSQVVSTIDIPATLLDLAGAAFSGMAGRSFRALLEQDSARFDERGGVLVSSAGLSTREKTRAWIEPGIKLIVVSGRTGERASLFDLRADPDEKNDVIASRAEDAKRLRRAMDDFLAKQPAESEPVKVE